MLLALLQVGMQQLKSNFALPSASSSPPKFYRRTSPRLTEIYGDADDEDEDDHDDTPR